VKKRKLERVRFGKVKIKKFRFCSFKCRQRRRRAVNAALSIGIIGMGVAQIKQIHSTKAVTRLDKIKKSLAIAETVININRAVMNTMRIMV
jgi:hypothetical protein